MKIFLIDKYGKNCDIAKGIKRIGFESIEIKEECKFKATKNDLIILIDNLELDGLSKTAPVILITKNKDEKFIWKFIHTYNCIDIIDENMNHDYIINRLIDKIRQD